MHGDGQQRPGRLAPEVAEQDRVGPAGKVRGRRREPARAKDKRRDYHHDVKGRRFGVDKLVGGVEREALARDVGEQVVGELLLARVVDEVVVAYNRAG